MCSKLKIITFYGFTTNKTCEEHNYKISNECTFNVRERLLSSDTLKNTADEGHKKHCCPDTPPPGTAFIFQVVLITAALSSWG